MRILDRLVLRTFIRLFTLSVLATPPLFILADLTEELDRYLDQPEVTGLDVALGYLYQVPQYVVLSFPIATLIATIFTIHGMTSHREVLAAKAGGVSFRRLVAPVFLMGFILTGVALGLTELAPRANKVAFSILQGEERGGLWRSSFVYQTDSGLTLKARYLSVEDLELEDVLIQRAAKGDTPAVWIQAATAEWDSADGWTLVDGFYRRIYDDPSAGETFQFQRSRVVGLAETPEDLLQDPPEEEEMTYREIDELASRIERSGNTPFELRVKQEQKIAIPFAALVVMLFGAPLATSSKRGGAAYGIGVALGTTILYMVILRVAGGFGYAGTIPALHAAWLPNAVFFVAGIFLMARVRT